MGILVSIFVTILLFSFASSQMFFKTKEVEARNKNHTFLSDKSSIGTKNAIDYFDSEEVEKAFIRNCQASQSWILVCKNCYLSGKTNCPYPTDSFCQSAKAVDMTDSSIFWSFLPNSSGTISEIQGASTIDNLTMTNVSQLGQGSRFYLNRVFDYQRYSNYRYSKPSGKVSDACGVSEIVGN